jgi:hypothetical protein
MIDYSLKFNTQQEWEDVAPLTDGVAVDVIGPINGKGFHVNVRILDGDIPKLKPFAINPNTPYRVWA